jgi:hypothetical protein
MNNTNLDERIRIEMLRFSNRIRAATYEAIEIDFPCARETSPPFQSLISTYNRTNNVIKELRQINDSEESNNQNEVNNLLGAIQEYQTGMISNTEEFDRVLSLNKICRTYSRTLANSLNYAIEFCSNNNLGNRSQSELPQRVRINNRINALNELSTIAQSDVTEENVSRLCNQVEYVIDTYLYRADGSNRLEEVRIFREWASGWSRYQK